ncbi:WXG100-like domain-containing protein, partial [Couchioplanes caeruleus]
MPDMVIPDDPEWAWAYTAILYTSGEEWPKANEPELRALSDELDTFANDLFRAATGVNALAGNVFDSLNGETAEAFYAANKNVMSSIPQSAFLARDLAVRTRNFALDTEHTKYTVTIAMFTTVLDIYLALASGFPALVPFHIATGGAIVRALIRGLKLRQAASAGQRVPIPPVPKPKHGGPPPPGSRSPDGPPSGSRSTGVPPPVKDSSFPHVIKEIGEEAIEEAGDETFESLAAYAVQAAEGNPHEVDAKDLAIGAAFGAAGGANVAAFKQLADRLAPKFSKSATGEGTIEAAGELPTEALAMGVFGGDFGNLGATAVSAFGSGALTKVAEDLSAALGGGANPNDGAGGGDGEIDFGGDDAAGDDAGEGGGAGSDAGEGGAGGGDTGSDSGSQSAPPPTEHGGLPGFGSGAPPAGADTSPRGSDSDGAIRPDQSGISRPGSGQVPSDEAPPTDATPGRREQDSGSAPGRGGQDSGSAPGRGGTDTGAVPGEAGTPRSGGTSPVAGQPVTGQSATGSATGNSTSPALGNGADSARGESTSSEVGRSTGPAAEAARESDGANSATAGNPATSASPAGQLGGQPAGQPGGQPSLGSGGQSIAQPGGQTSSPAGGQSGSQQGGGQTSGSQQPVNPNTGTQQSTPPSEKTMPASVEGPSGLDGHSGPEQRANHAEVDPAPGESGQAAVETPVRDAGTSMSDDAATGTPDRDAAPPPPVQTVRATTYDAVELPGADRGVPPVVADSYRAAGLEVPTEARPQVGRIDGLIAYDHGVRADGQHAFTVRVHLKPEDDVARAEQQAVEQRVRAAVDRVFNGGGRVAVAVEFVGDSTAAHTTIGLSSGPGVITQTQWPTTGSGLELAHEIGHYLGLADEYRDDREFGRVLYGSGDEDSLMGTTDPTRNPDITDRQVDKMIETVGTAAVSTEDDHGDALGFRAAPQAGDSFVNERFADFAANRIHIDAASYPLVRDQLIDAARNPGVTIEDMRASMGFVVNMIMPASNVHELGAVIDAITAGMRHPGQVAFVVGINTRTGNAGRELNNAVATAAEIVEQSPYPIAIVGHAVGTAKSFPFGAARNAVLNSVETTQAIEAFAARGLYPYVSIQDADTEPRKTVSGEHIFDRVQDETAYAEDVDDAFHAGSDYAMSDGSYGGESSRRWLSRPLMMTGGYRPGDRHKLVTDTRRRLREGRSELKRQIPELENQVDEAELRADRAAEELEELERLDRSGIRVRGRDLKAAQEALKQATSTLRSAKGARTSVINDLAKTKSAIRQLDTHDGRVSFYGDFEQAIADDMATRNRQRNLNSLLPYAPEPNLFVDGVLVRGDRKVRFSEGGGGEYAKLSEHLGRAYARELKAAYGDPDEAAGAAQNNRHPTREEAFRLDYEGWAVPTDLSRLAADFIRGKPLPQTHTTTQKLGDRFFGYDEDNRTESGPSNAKYAKTGTHLGPFSQAQGSTPNPLVKPYRRTAAMVKQHGGDKKLKPRKSFESYLTSTQRRDLGDHPMNTLAPQLTAGIPPEHKVYAARQLALSNTANTIRQDFANAAATLAAARADWQYRYALQPGQQQSVRPNSIYDALAQVQGFSADTIRDRVLGTPLSDTLVSELADRRLIADYEYGHFVDAAVSAPRVLHPNAGAELDGLSDDDWRLEMVRRLAAHDVLTEAIAAELNMSIVVNGPYSKMQHFVPGAPGTLYLDRWIDDRDRVTYRPAEYSPMRSAPDGAPVAEVERDPRRPERVDAPVPRERIDALRDSVVPRRADSSAFDVKPGEAASGVPDRVRESYEAMGLPAPEAARPQVTGVEGRIAYDYRKLSGGVHDFTVKVHLRPRGDTTREQQADVEQRARSAAEQAFNQGFQFADGQLNVNLEFVGDPAEAHAVIDLHGETTMTQMQWSAAADDLAFAHEIAHFLGLGDEYVDERVFHRDAHAPQVHSASSMMASTDPSSSPGMMQRHLEEIARTAEASLSPDRGDLPPPAHDPVTAADLDMPARPAPPTAAPGVSADHAVTTLADWGFDLAASSEVAAQFAHHHRDAALSDHSAEVLASPVLRDAVQRVDRGLSQFSPDVAARVRAFVRDGVVSTALARTQAHHEVTPWTPQQLDAVMVHLAHEVEQGHDPLMDPASPLRGTGYDPAESLPQRTARLWTLNLTPDGRASLTRDPLFDRMMRSPAALDAALTGAVGPDEQRFLNTCDPAVTNTLLRSVAPTIAGQVLLGRDLATQIEAAAEAVGRRYPDLLTQRDQRFPGRTLGGLVDERLAQARESFDGLERRAHTLLGDGETDPSAWAKLSDEWGRSMQKLGGVVDLVAVAGPAGGPGPDGKLSVPVLSKKLFDNHWLLSAALSLPLAADRPARRKQGVDGDTYRRSAARLLDQEAAPSGFRPGRLSAPLGGDFWGRLHRAGPQPVGIAGRFGGHAVAVGAVRVGGELAFVLSDPKDTEAKVLSPRELDQWVSGNRSDMPPVPDLPVPATSAPGQPSQIPAFVPPGDIVTDYHLTHGDTPPFSRRLMDADVHDRGAGSPFPRYVVQRPLVVDKHPPLHVSEDRTVAMNATADGQRNEFYTTAARVEQLNEILRRSGKVTLKTVPENTVRVGDGPELVMVQPANPPQTDVCRDFAAGVLGGKPSHVVLRPDGRAVPGTAQVAPINSGDGMEITGTHHLAEHLTTAARTGRPEEVSTSSARDAIGQDARPEGRRGGAPRPGREYGLTVHSNPAMNDAARAIGVNQYARSQVGEAYLTQSISDRGSDEDTGFAVDHSQEGRPVRLAGAYGYHFAAVVAESSDGTVHVTLENERRGIDVAAVDEALRLNAEHYVNDGVPTGVDGSDELADSLPGLARYLDDPAAFAEHARPVREALLGRSPEYGKESDLWQFRIWGEDVPSSHFAANQESPYFVNPLTTVVVGGHTGGTRPFAVDFEEGSREITGEPLGLGTFTTAVAREAEWRSRNGLPQLSVVVEGGGNGPAVPLAGGPAETDAGLARAQAVARVVRDRLDAAPGDAARQVPVRSTSRGRRPAAYDPLQEPNRPSAEKLQRRTTASVRRPAAPDQAELGTRPAPASDAAVPGSASSSPAGTGSPAGGEAPPRTDAPADT